MVMSGALSGGSLKIFGSSEGGGDGDDESEGVGAKERKVACGGGAERQGDGVTVNTDLGGQCHRGQVTGGRLGGKELRTKRGVLEVERARMRGGARVNGAQMSLRAMSKQAA